MDVANCVMAYCIRTCAESVLEGFFEDFFDVVAAVSSTFIGLLVKLLIALNGDLFLDKLRLRKLLAASILYLFNLQRDTNNNKKNLHKWSLNNLASTQN